MQTAERTMSIAEALLARQSVRSFRPDPVPESIIREILDLARRSPSWANTQPWDVTVVTGRALAAIKEAHAAKLRAGAEAGMEVTAPRFTDRYNQRRRENGLRLFETLGITRADVDKRDRYDLSMLRFFEAPVGLIFCIDAEILGPWVTLDLGILMQSIMLGAVGFGLGTCPEAAVTRYPEVLREVLAIAPEKRIVCGLALGYPDVGAIENQHRSNRIPLEEFVTWKVE